MVNRIYSSVHLWGLNFLFFLKSSLIDSQGIDSTGQDADWFLMYVYGEDERSLPLAEE